MSEPHSTAKTEFDFPDLLDGLNRYLRLRSIGMKRFKTREEMEAITRIRRPLSKLTTDQVVEGLAAPGRNGFRYPIPPWGIQDDPSASMAVSCG